MRSTKKVVLASAVLLACAGDVGMGPPQEQAFIAYLSAPSDVSTDASGVALFVVLPNGWVEFAVGADKLAGVTAVHVYNAMNDQPVAPLFTSADTTGELNGTFASGELTPASLSSDSGMTLDDLVASFAAGGAYVNVRTAEYEAGELRGAIYRYGGEPGAARPPVR